MCFIYIFFSAFLKKEVNPVIYDNMDEFRGLYVE
jgi:hypothetical protein